MLPHQKASHEWLLFLSCATGTSAFNLIAHRDFFVSTLVRGDIFSHRVNICLFMPPLLYLCLFHSWHFQNDWQPYKQSFLHSGKRILDAVQTVTTNSNILQKSTYFVTTEEGNLIPSHWSLVHCPIHIPLIKAECSTLSTELKGMKNFYPRLFSKQGAPLIISIFSSPTFSFQFGYDHNYWSMSYSGFFGGGGLGGFGWLLAFLKNQIFFYSI